MKAIVCNRYGTPDVLKHCDVATPLPKDNEALVNIRATSINAADMEILTGQFVNRIAAPFKPMRKILGTDVAGVIERVGKNVTLFKPGDQIWGDLSFPLGSGTFAEYVCIPEEALRLKPPTMSFEEAAAFPTAGVVALQHLIAKRQLEKEHKVLINGAGGSVGTVAVQIARHFGAEVTCVDRTDKMDMLLSLGADHVIDYTREDFTHNGNQYDLILDVVANRWIFDYKRALSSDGICLMVGGSMTKVFTNIIIGKLASRDKYIGLGMWKPNRKEDLDFLQKLFESGEVKPVIDKVYPLKGVPEAFRYFQGGHAKGKLVITVT